MVVLPITSLTFLSCSLLCLQGRALRQATAPTLAEASLPSFEQWPASLGTTAKEFIEKISQAKAGQRGSELGDAMKDFFGKLGKTQDKAEESTPALKGIDYRSAIEEHPGPGSASVDRRPLEVREQHLPPTPNGFDFNNAMKGFLDTLSQAGTTKEKEVMQLPQAPKPEPLQAPPVPEPLKRIHEMPQQQPKQEATDFGKKVKDLFERLSQARAQKLEDEAHEQAWRQDAEPLQNQAQNQKQAEQRALNPTHELPWVEPTTEASANAQGLPEPTSEQKASDLGDKLKDFWQKLGQARTKKLEDEAREPALTQDAEQLQKQAKTEKEVEQLPHVPQPEQLQPRPRPEAPKRVQETVPQQLPVHSGFEFGDNMKQAFDKLHDRSKAPMEEMPSLRKELPWQPQRAQPQKSQPASDFGDKLKDFLKKLGEARAKKLEDEEREQALKQNSAPHQKGAGQKREAEQPPQAPPPEQLQPQPRLEAPKSVREAAAQQRPAPSEAELGDVASEASDRLQERSKMPMGDVPKGQERPWQPQGAGPQRSPPASDFGDKLRDFLKKLGEAKTKLEDETREQALKQDSAPLQKGVETERAPKQPPQVPQPEQLQPQHQSEAPKSVQEVVPPQPPLQTEFEFGDVMKQAFNKLRESSGMPMEEAPKGREELPWQPHGAEPQKDQPVGNAGDIFAGAKQFQKRLNGGSKMPTEPVPVKGELKKLPPQVRGAEPQQDPSISSAGDMFAGAKEFIKKLDAMRAESERQKRQPAANTPQQHLAVTAQKERQASGSSILDDFANAKDYFQKLSKATDQKADGLVSSDFLTKTENLVKDVLSRKPETRADKEIHKQIGAAFARELEKVKGALPLEQVKLLQTANLFGWVKALVGRKQLPDGNQLIVAGDRSGLFMDHSVGSVTGHTGLIEKDGDRQFFSDGVVFGQGGPPLFYTSESHQPKLSAPIMDLIKSLKVLSKTPMKSMKVAVQDLQKREDVLGHIAKGYQNYESHMGNIIKELQKPKPSPADLAKSLRSMAALATPKQGEVPKPGEKVPQLEHSSGYGPKKLSGAPGAPTEVQQQDENRKHFAEIVRSFKEIKKQEEAQSVSAQQEKAPKEAAPKQEMVIRQPEHLPGTGSAGALRGSTEAQRQEESQKRFAEIVKGFKEIKKQEEARKVEHPEERVQGEDIQIPNAALEDFFKGLKALVSPKGQTA